LRELVRAVQDARKEKGLNVSDKAKLVISAEGAALDFIKKNEARLKKTTGLESVSYQALPDAARISAGDYALSLKLS
jgi:valyl-tRNA synthetase